MTSANTAQKLAAERGPRYAVQGTIRPNEVEFSYAPNAAAAEVMRKHYEDSGYYQIRVHPPVGSADLAKLGRERVDAKRVLREKTAVLRAAVMRAIEEGRAEAEIARTAGIDRMTVRAWAGK